MVYNPVSASMIPLDYDKGNLKNIRWNLSKTVIKWIYPMCVPSKEDYRYLPGK